MAEWRHAGQVFCEMLGQICHPELYSISPDKQLEVHFCSLALNLMDQTFVIHSRHTTARIFYCKFPIPYLRNIVKHGAHYKSRVVNPQGVYLQHTKHYQLRDPALRLEFFNIVCRLLTYITSGDSHIPFLWNHPENAINVVTSPYTFYISTSTVSCIIL
jgi:hypothetical protein